MEVKTLIEAKRGCGFRKPGMYLMGPVLSEPCERLPFEFYGGLPKFSRGWRKIDPVWLFDVSLHPVCVPTLPMHRHDLCPVCSPPGTGAHYLMWVGKQYYTPESFLNEAGEMGVSKRIANVPDDFVFGESFVYLGHIEAAHGEPGCFAAFMPTHVDLVVEDELHVPSNAEELNEKFGGHLRVVKVIPDEEQPDGDG
jgi:hypothetical protein